MKNIFKVFIFTIVLSPFLNSQGTVILLNGTSSAGKSSIMKELPEILDGFWQPVEADAFAVIARKNFIDYLKEKFGVETTLEELNDTYIALNKEGRITEREVDAFFDKQDVLGQMFEKIRTDIQEEKNVIIDTVIGEGIDDEDPDNADYAFKTYFDALHTFNVAFILVYCPFAALIERVEMRNQAGVYEERREFGVPLWMFGKTYKKARPGDTPILETLTKTEVTNLFERYAKEDFKTEREYNKYLSILLKDLSLDRNESIQVTPRLKYDFVVNTGVYSTQEVAVQIKQFMETNPVLTAFRENYERIGWRDKLKYRFKKFFGHNSAKLDWKKKNAFLLRA